LRLGDDTIRILAAIGAFSLLAAAFIHLSTFFPVNGPYLTVGVLLLVAPMVLVFGGAILAANGRRFRIDIPSRGPGLAIAMALLALSVYAGINFFVTRLPGQPEASAGGYYLNSHGSRAAINREQYEEALRLQVRLFSGHILLFIGVGTALLLAALGAERPAALARPAVSVDLTRRRIDATPRARIFLGVFGVVSALVLAYWLLSGPWQAGPGPLWALAVVAITVFNIVRYWRWIARGRSGRR